MLASTQPPGVSPRTGKALRARSAGLRRAVLSSQLFAQLPAPLSKIGFVILIFLVTHSRSRTESVSDRTGERETLRQALSPRLRLGFYEPGSSASDSPLHIGFVILIFLVTHSRSRTKSVSDRTGERDSLRQALSPRLRLGFYESSSPASDSPLHIGFVILIFLVTHSRDRTGERDSLRQALSPRLRLGFYEPSSPASDSPLHIGFVILIFLVTHSRDRTGERDTLRQALSPRLRLGFYESGSSGSPLQNRLWDFGEGLGVRGNNRQA